MKKRIALILMACLMALTGAAACAEGAADLSAYSDSELIALLDDVQSEIALRHIEKTAQLTAGTYIGGHDIPAGTYVLAAAGDEDDSGIMSLRSVNDSEDEYPSKLYEFEYGDSGYSIFLTMEKGDTLIVPFPCTLTISGGIMFK